MIQTVIIQARILYFYIGECFSSLTVKKAWSILSYSNNYHIP